jgi:hypothetical protein
MRKKNLNLKKSTIANLNDEEMEKILAGLSSSVPDDYTACPTCAPTRNISVEICV